MIVLDVSVFGGFLTPADELFRGGGGVGKLGGGNTKTPARCIYTSTFTNQYISTDELEDLTEI